MVNSSLPPIVIDLSSGGKKKAVAQNNAPTSDSSQSAGTNIEKAMKNLVSYGAIKHTADKIVSYQIGTVELRTGAREYEQKLQFGYQVGGKLLNTAVMIGGAAATGNLPLAVIGVATSAMSTGLDIWQKQNTININENREDIAIAMQMNRAGNLGRRNGS